MKGRPAFSVGSIDAVDARATLLQFMRSWRLQRLQRLPGIPPRAAAKTDSKRLIAPVLNSNDDADISRREGAGCRISIPAVIPRQPHLVSLCKLMLRLSHLFACRDARTRVPKRSAQPDNVASMSQNVQMSAAISDQLRTDNNFATALVCGELFLNLLKSWG